MYIVTLIINYITNFFKCFFFEYAFSLKLITITGFYYCYFVTDNYNENEINRQVVKRNQNGSTRLNIRTFIYSFPSFTEIVGTNNGHNMQGKFACPSFFWLKQPLLGPTEQEEHSIFNR